MEISKEQLVDGMMGFFKTKTITTALDLGICDVLATAEAATAEQICSEINIPLHAGKRLLIALTSMGLVDKEGEQYLLTDSGRQYMVKDSPEWLGWLARHIDTFLYPLWANTSQAISKGSDQRETVFGDNRSWFDILYQNPADVADFQEFLGIFAKPFIDGVVQDFDFSKHQRFMDIGSGIGTLPLAVADQYPELDIGICELPQAADFVRNKISVSRHASRIEVLEGDVLSGQIPAQAYDLIHLGWMLHDYAPETQIEILKHIHEALPPKGAFIASETPLDDDERGPLFTSLLSINMLVSTDGGVESTASQYMERFREAGFVNVQVMDISGPRTLFYGEKAADAFCA